MEWNVFYHDVNKQEIRTLNIFKHGTFKSYVEKHLKECTDKDEFAQKLKYELQYYFWSRAEYEIIIGPWVGGRDTEDVKVDIYTQVMNNWQIFLDYVWDSKKHKKNIVDRECVELTGECPMCEDCPDDCPLEKNK